MEVLPDSRRKIYAEAGINPINIEKIISNKQISDYLLDIKANLVIASNLLLGEISAYLNKTGKKLEETKLSKDKFTILVDKLDKKEINNQIFKEILVELMETNNDINKIIESKKSDSIDEDKLISIIENIINLNPASVEDYKQGKDRAIKFLMGQVMKETKGKADPKLANTLLVDELSKR